MSRQMLNRFTCDANGCTSDAVYTAQAIPDGWTHFEYDSRFLWSCPARSIYFIDFYGRMSDA